MPIMTVTTLSNKPLEEKSKLAKDLTEEVHAVMGVPKNVIRVIFHEIPEGSYTIAGEFLSPDSGDPALRDDTILRISILSGRPAEEKAELIRHLYDAIKRNPPFSTGAVRVIIDEMPRDNFYRSAP